MTVTALGLLKLKPSFPIDDPEVRAGIAEAKKAVQEFTSIDVCYYLQQVEDPSFICMLSEWGPHRTT
jgi:hypothetical protein